MLILENSSSDGWQLIGPAADIDEADSLTQGRRGEFLVVDTEALTVTGFRRVLQREDISPPGPTALPPTR